jgi:hypothetical protein
VRRLTGTGIGPEVPGRYDLDGDVTFTTGSGCAPFDYGYGQAPAAPPPTPPARQRKSLRR